MSPASYRAAPPRGDGLTVWVLWAACKSIPFPPPSPAVHRVGFGVGVGAAGGVAVPVGFGVAGGVVGAGLALLCFCSLASSSSAALSRFCASPYAAQSLLVRAVCASAYARLAASIA